MSAARGAQHPPALGQRVPFRVATIGLVRVATTGLVRVATIGVVR
jgi:hypothetical protein